MGRPETPGLPVLEVRLIGELCLLADGEALPLPASRKTRALFVYLLRCGKPVRRERLCELFFDIPDDPRAALRWSLTKIRAMLGPHAARLVTDRERVELRGEGVQVDADRMTYWLGGAALAGGLRPYAEAALEAPLPGLELAGLDEWNAWLAAERGEIDLLRARFLARAAQHCDLSEEQRRLFARKAKELGCELGLEALPLAPIAAPDPSQAQSVHYCFAPDGVRIAYACTGQGAPLVKAANWLNHLELDWSGPIWGGLFAALSDDNMLVRYDERGNGLSDWVVEDLTFEAFVRDLETVVDHLGLTRFPLLGISQGCAVSIAYASRHPERVSKLILIGGYAAGWRHVASHEEAAQREAIITLAAHGWGQDNPVYRQLFTQTFIPSASHEELDWFNDFQRKTASAENAVRFLEAFSRIDVRHLLKTVKAPTLVIHSRGDQRVPATAGMEIASGIDGASLVTLDSDNHIPLSREPASAIIIDRIRAFLAA